MAARPRGWLETVLLAALASSAPAQPCALQWTDRFRVQGVELVDPPTGYSWREEVRALLVHDLDDGGPQGPALVVAGSFNRAGGVPAGNIASWDGERWDTMAGGFGQPVASLALFDQDGPGPQRPALYAGLGAPFGLQTPSLNPLYRWQAGSWVAVPLPEACGSPSVPWVPAMTVMDLDGAGPLGQELVFGRMCGTGLSAWWNWNIISWDGQAAHVRWVAPFDDAVVSMAAFDDDGAGPQPTALYVATVSHTTHKYWYTLRRYQYPDPPTTISFQFDNGVGSLGVFDLDGPGPGREELIALGGLTDFPGIPGSFSALRWNGSTWSAMTGDPITALGAADHDGSGPSAPVLYAGTIKRWTGSTWTPVVSGWGNYMAMAGFADGVNPGGESLYIGGRIDRTPALPALNLVRWSGAAWAPLGHGLNNDVHAMLAYNDGSGPLLYAGGAFTITGGEKAVGIAAWDGEHWATVGSANNHVDCLALANLGGSSLYAGGKFTSIGGTACSRIARRTASGWAPLGSGLDGNVLAMAAHSSGGAALYAAGAFTHAGTLAASRVARWNGQAWSALGSGLNDEAYALASFQNSLFAGGKFTTAGGQPIANFARWDGAAWSAVSSGGSGVNGPVRALVVHDDGAGSSLFVGGEFDQAGGGPSGPVARWDGVIWHPMGAVLSGEVRTLKVFDVDSPAGGGSPLLFAGGRYAVGAGPTGGLASWNGTMWTSVPGTTDGLVLTLATFDPDAGGPAPPSLLLGGEFSSAAGVPAARIAELRGCACFADCNRDSLLNLADFGCFTTKFALADPYADCNRDGVLNLSDFGCFQTQFAIGCP